MADKWTSEALNFLTRKWPYMSATVIAAQLTARTGHAFTKNAVIGKATRLGLSKGPVRKVITMPKPKPPSPKPASPRLVEKTRDQDMIDLRICQLMDNPPHGFAMTAADAARELSISFPGVTLSRNAVIGQWRRIKADLDASEAVS